MCFCNALKFSIHVRLDHSVLNTLRSMVLDEDGLDKEVIHRMRDFITRDEVYHFAAAKVLLTLLERYVS